MQKKARVRSSQFRPRAQDATERLLKRAATCFLARDFVAALACYEQILAAPHSAKHAIALCNAGAVHLELGQLADAERTLRRAIAVQQNHFLAWRNLAAVLRRTGDLAGSRTAYESAVRIDGSDGACLAGLGAVLFDLGCYREAARIFGAAKILLPHDHAICGDAGAALRASHQLVEAESCTRTAIALAPAVAAYHNTLGTILKMSGDVVAAGAAFAEAVRLEPDFAAARWNQATTFLLEGDFAQGWPLFDWRWKTPNFPSAIRNFPQPPWHGEPIAGRTLLVHCEQGIGDSLQFVRYLPLLQSFGARVALECQRPLQRLFAASREGLGIDVLVAAGDPLPAFDCHVPLMSLPALLAAGIADIPAQTPYLTVPQDLVQSWRDRGPRSATRKVAILWAGAATYRDDSLRSPGLQALLPLFEVPDVQFVGLQVGAGRDASAMPKNKNFVDLGGHLTDFADTAAILMNSDLVISPDTSTLHLAGALGRPAWGVIPFAPDWRWMRGREDTPWYPTMRLFRQDATREWSWVIARVAAALKQKQ